MALRRAGGLVAILAAGPLPAQHQTTFAQAYDDGLLAQKRGEHTVAVLAFRRALELHPQSSPRLLTYGNNVTTYYPQVHLAESLLALGRLDEAAQALEASLRSKVEPASLREGAELRLRELRAARKPPTSAAPLPAAQVDAPPPQRQAPDHPPEPVTKAAERLPAEGSQVLGSPKSQEAMHPQLSAARPALPVTGGATRPVPGRDGAAPPAGSAPADLRTQASPAPTPVAGPGLSSTLRWALAVLGAALMGTAYGLLRRKRRPGPGPVDQPTVALPQPVPAELAVRLQALPADLGPYTLERVLGQGSFAITYGGFRRSDRLRVAVKVPHPHVIRDAEAMNRFRQETLLGALLDHPAIVRLADPSPQSGLPWMAMELVEGETLQEYLARKGRLEVAEVLGLGAEIMAALAHAHGKGVVHRDLKPSNVMVSHGHAKVMDFGIARVLDTAGLTATALFLGTPAYAAPESLKGSRVGPPADRYALGIILFEMLAGQPPFQAEHPLAVLDMHRSMALPDLGSLRPEAPRRLIRLVERLAAKDPEERPEDPEVLTILAELAPH